MNTMMDQMSAYAVSNKCLATAYPGKMGPGACLGFNSLAWTAVGFVLLQAPTSADGLTLKITPKDPVAVTSGKYTTTMDPKPTLIGLGADVNLLNLFKTDYPKDPDGNVYTYQNAGAAINGTLTIGTLSLLQDGTFGGMSLVANLSGATAPHTFRWLQYISLDPAPGATTDFRGEKRSPFTDPPDKDRDDTLPFYETNTERTTAGVGYTTGGNVDNDIRFWDSPKALDSRADATGSFKFRLNLFLTDFDTSVAKAPKITVYQGLSYGFNISAVPEPIHSVYAGGVLLAFGGAMAWRRRREIGGAA